MKRRSFTNGDVVLSALDSGGDGPLLLCLHALWMQAGSFRALADRMLPDWRVVALDLRGHGHSSRASDYGRDAIHSDLVTVIEALDAGPATIIGNSIGGTFAIQLAARRPDLVRAIVNEEGAIIEDTDLPFIEDWRGTFPDRAAFARAAGPLYWCLAPSVQENGDGSVRLGIDVDDLRAILTSLEGGFARDWQAVQCPVLIVTGRDSHAVEPGAMQQMVDARPGTELAVVDGGHVAHEDNLTGFLRAVTPFLTRVRGEP